MVMRVEIAVGSGRPPASPGAKKTAKSLPTAEGFQTELRKQAPQASPANDPARAAAKGPPPAAARTDGGGNESELDDAATGAEEVVPDAVEFPETIDLADGEVSGKVEAVLEQTHVAKAAAEEGAAMEVAAAVANPIVAVPEAMAQDDSEPAPAQSIAISRVSAEAPEARATPTAARAAGASPTGGTAAEAASAGSSVGSIGPKEINTPNADAEAAAPPQTQVAGRRSPVQIEGVIRESDVSAIAAEGTTEAANKPVDSSTSRRPPEMVAAAGSAERAAGAAAAVDAIDPAEPELASVSSSRWEANVAGTDQKAQGAPPRGADRASALPAAPEARFAEENHAKIVTQIRGELLPHGGRMQIRLDPPELGVMHVSVQMRDGVMTAAFQTSSEQAASLLSHSLHHLKGALESQGVQVEKLQVQQAPRDFDSRGGDGQQRQSGQEDPSQRQEQQRRNLLQRLWAKLGLGGEPLDVTG